MRAGSRQVIDVVAIVIENAFRPANGRSAVYSVRPDRNQLVSHILLCQPCARRTHDKGKISRREELNPWAFLRIHVSRVATPQSSALRSARAEKPLSGRLVSRSQSQGGGVPMLLRFGFLQHGPPSLDQGFSYWIDYGLSEGETLRLRLATAP